MCVDTPNKLQETFLSKHLFFLSPGKTQDRPPPPDQDRQDEGAAVCAAVVAPPVALPAFLGAIRRQLPGGLQPSLVSAGGGARQQLEQHAALPAANARPGGAGGGPPAQPPVPLAAHGDACHAALLTVALRRSTKPLPIKE